MDLTIDICYIWDDWKIMADDEKRGIWLPYMFGTKWGLNQH